MSNVISLNKRFPTRVTAPEGVNWIDSPMNEVSLSKDAKDVQRLIKRLEGYLAELDSEANYKAVNMAIAGIMSAKSVLKDELSLLKQKGK